MVVDQSHSPSRVDPNERTTSFVSVFGLSQMVSSIQVENFESELWAVIFCLVQQASVVKRI